MCGSGIPRSMRALLGSERRWRNVCLQIDTSADTVEDINIEGKKAAFLAYQLLNVFDVSPNIHLPLHNPGKVYVESISVEASMRATSTVQYRMLVASRPTDSLTASFSGRPKDDHMSRAPTTIEQPLSDTPMAASNPVCQVFRSSPLSPFHHAGVKGCISLGGKAVGASLGPNAEVQFDSGMQCAEDPNGEVIILIKITIRIGAWHNMTADRIQLMRVNMYFLFCSKACPDGIVLDCGILLSACPREQ